MNNIIKEFSFTIAREDNFNGALFNWKDKFEEDQILSIEKLSIILPKTPAPFNHGQDDNKKNIKNFPMFFSSIFETFDNLKFLSLVEAWPYSIYYIFSDFQDIVEDYTYNDTKYLQNLEKLDIGFMGYNVLDQNEEVWNFFGSGVLKHVQSIEWRTRCDIGDHIGDDDFFLISKYSENLSNIFWEGTNLIDYIDEDERYNKKKF